MATVAAPEIEALGRSLAGPRFDEYSGLALGRAYDEFVARRRTPLAALELSVNDRPYPTVYAALADPTADFTVGELRFVPPFASDPAWEYVPRTDRIVFSADGAAEIHPAGGGAPRRAMARVLLREHFLPRSRLEEERAAAGGLRVQLPTRVGTLAQGMTICRAQPVLPFSVALLLYLPEERTRLEIDLVRSTLLADPRAGRLPVARRVPRPARLAWAVDRVLGQGDLSLTATRALEVLVESNGLSSIELAHIFGGVRELIDSALQGLVAQRLVTVDHRTGTYRARLEAFLPDAASSVRPDESPYATDPTLRTSVQELLAAADARASCPLCGRPLPPGPSSILCADCAALVAGA
ncbi:MAG TPA: hypothetical protein VMG36_00990 [Thermoplasmata archaeon]|nr:hypothetical protein [Thermoplasmata archaeon]